jgi:hypothetical protein
MQRRNRKKSAPRKRNKGRRGGGLFPTIGNAGDVITKRLTFSTVLATGAGTAIPVTSFTSPQVQSNPATEWASFAARYQEYRVRAIRVRGKAVNPIQTATITHSELYLGDTMVGNTPGSAAQILSDERSRQVTTTKDFTYVVTSRGNPNASLWTSSAGAITSPNSFEVVLASPTTPALTTATTYYAVTVEWLVEFRGSQ